MWIICDQCGAQAKPEKQIVEYVRKQKDALDILVLSKVTFMIDCVNCGTRSQAESGARI